MAADAKDSRIMEYKDTISQLNKTIKSQNKTIETLNGSLASLNETLGANAAEMAKMREQIDYLTKKLFGTSSEKSQNILGQYSLFVSGK